MKKILFYILILLATNLFCQKNFSSCNKGLDNYVWGLYNDTVINKLIVWGYFNYADGKLVKGMATWDGQNFDSLGTGIKYGAGGKKDVITRYKSKLYAQFSDMYLYSFDYSTKVWTKIPFLFDDVIRDFTIYNDELIIVGDFKKVGSISVKNIIKYNGIAFDTLPKPLFSFYINSTIVYKNELYIGGNFDPTPFTAIAKFDGTNWVQVGSNTQLAGGQMVYCFKIYNNKLYVSGVWATLNGQSHPSLATWDGQTWGNVGNPIFSSGQPAPINDMKIYKNKLYIFGSVDCIINSPNNSDTVKTKSIAIWNDSIWCAAKLKINFLPINMENFNDKWYFIGGTTMIGDTVDYNSTTVPDTVNYLGKYIGNNGKLERDCFDKAISELPEGIYPNPTTDYVNYNLSLEFGEYCNLKVINNLGQIISNYQNINSNSKIDISPFSDGLYIFIFDNNGIQKTFKVLKR